MKNKIIILSILISTFIMSSVSAATVVFNFDTYIGSGSSLTLRDPSNGNVVVNSPIVNGNFAYDSLLGTSSGSITSAATGALPDISLYNMTITETSYGSLFMTAQMDSLGATNVNVFADLIVDYNYDANSDVTILTLSTLDTNNDGVPGGIITDSGFAGLSLDINGSMSYLAFVENQFPTYVPVPAAVWLFASGLIGLIGFAKRRA